MSAPKIPKFVASFNGIDFPVLRAKFTEPTNEAMDAVFLRESYNPTPPPPKFASGNISLQGLFIDLLSVEWNADKMTASVRVPDRETGDPLTLHFDVRFGRCETEEQLAEEIVKGLANVIAHELAEMVFVRGQRLDPHKRGPFFPADEALPALPEVTRA